MAPAGMASVAALEPSDRLAAAEFERRYDAMPDQKKAELIEGAACMPSPIEYGHHRRREIRLAHWLLHYELETAEVAAISGTTVRLEKDDKPQPDALLRI